VKPINALVLSLFAGTATFAAQHYFFPPRLHAAPFVVPDGPNWRQQMIDRYPGGTKVDHVLARFTDRLDLSPDQAEQVRPILQRHHDRVLALLVAGPSSMTRDQFLTKEHQIWAETRAQLDAVLTPEQSVLITQLAPPRTES
jgi:Spy/CpxP family protein refolding chaperone